MQAFLSWIVNPQKSKAFLLAAPPPPSPPRSQDPPGEIGTWTLEDMRRAMATGDVTILQAKAFPVLAQQLTKQPHKLCAKFNTMPAVEGGLIAFLGTLMRLHPHNYAVHYLSLRLLFCCLHATSSEQLATIASPVMAALANFRSSETKLSAPEGSLLSRTMMAGGSGGAVGGGGGNGFRNSGVNTANISASPSSAAVEPPFPHIIQEIHLMATAILCKISFAIPLPPPLATHCSEQLIALAKGNENPRLKRIEEEATRQQILQSAREAAVAEAKKSVASAAGIKGVGGSATTSNSKEDEARKAKVAEIEIYFSNRNREMRSVLSTMVGTAIEALHSASERFAPIASSYPLGVGVGGGSGAAWVGERAAPSDDEDDDDATFGSPSDQNNRLSSALFGPKPNTNDTITHRSLFDSHSILWLTVLEAVGEDIGSRHHQHHADVIDGGGGGSEEALKKAAVECVMAIATNSTRSQLHRRGLINVNHLNQTATTTLSHTAGRTTMTDRKRSAAAGAEGGGLSSTATNIIGDPMNSYYSSSSGYAYIPIPLGQSYNPNNTLNGGDANSSHTFLDTFFFSQRVIINVAQFLRLGYKGRWLAATDEHVRVLCNMFEEHVEKKRRGGQTSTNITMMTTEPIQHDQSTVDELILAIMGAFEYILLSSECNIRFHSDASNAMGESQHSSGGDDGGAGAIFSSAQSSSSNDMDKKNDDAGTKGVAPSAPPPPPIRVSVGNITNVSPIIQTIEAILTRRTAQLRTVPSDCMNPTSMTSVECPPSADLATSSAGGGGGDGDFVLVSVNRVTSILLPFVQSSHRLNIVCNNALRTLITKVREVAEVYVTPPASQVSDDRNKQRRQVGEANATNSAAYSSPQQQQQHPSLVLRSLALAQCNTLLAYNLSLQEAMESLWLSVHAKAPKAGNAHSDLVSALLTEQHVFMSIYLCKTIPETISQHLTFNPIPIVKQAVGRRNGSGAVDGGSGRGIVGFFSGLFGGDKTNTTAYDPSALQRQKPSRNATVSAVKREEEKKNGERGGGEGSDVDEGGVDGEGSRTNTTVVVNDPHSVVFTGTQVLMVCDIVAETATTQEQAKASEGHSATTATSTSSSIPSYSSDCIVGVVFPFLERLLYIEPLVLMLCAYPFNLPPLDILLSSSRGECVIFTNSNGTSSNSSSKKPPPSAVNSTSPSPPPLLSQQQQLVLSTRLVLDTPPSHHKRGGGGGAAMSAPPSSKAFTGPAASAQHYQQFIASCPKVNYANADHVLSQLLRCIFMMRQQVMRFERPQTLATSNSNASSTASTGGAPLTTPSTTASASSVAWGAFSAIGVGVFNATSAIASAAISSLVASTTDSSPSSAVETALRHPSLAHKTLSQRLFVSHSDLMSSMQRYFIGAPALLKVKGKGGNSRGSSSGNNNQKKSTNTTNINGVDADFLISLLSDTDEAIAFAKRFNEELLFSTLLDSNNTTSSGMSHATTMSSNSSNKDGLFDGVALKRIERAATVPTAIPVIGAASQSAAATLLDPSDATPLRLVLPPPPTPSLDLSRLSLDHLGRLASLYRRHQGLMFNDHHVRIIDAMLSREMPPSLLTKGAGSNNSSHGGGGAVTTTTPPMPLSSSLKLDRAAIDGDGTLDDSILSHIRRRPDVIIAAAAGLGPAEKAALNDIGVTITRRCTAVASVVAKGTKAMPSAASASSSSSFASSPAESLFFREVLSFLPQTSTDISTVKMLMERL